MEGSNQYFRHRSRSFMRPNQPGNIEVGNVASSLRQPYGCVNGLAKIVGPKGDKHQMREVKGTRDGLRKDAPNISVDVGAVGRLPAIEDRPVGRDDASTVEVGPDI